MLEGRNTKMHTKPGLLIACALAGLVISGTGRARALSCALPELWAPAPDAADVPINTLVWCSGNRDGAASQVVVTGADGETVSGTQTRMSSPAYELLVFRPDSDLAPNSEYDVVCPRVYDSERAFSFTTGASSRSTPPAVPDIATKELIATLGDGWGASYHVLFRQVAQPGDIIVLDLGGTSTLAPQGPTGYVADSQVMGSYAQDFWLGTGPCGGNWPGAALGASTTIALGAFALTGEFSGWSDTIRVTLPATHDDVPSMDGEDVSSSDEPPNAADVVDVPELDLVMAEGTRDVVAPEASPSTSVRRPPVELPERTPSIQGRATCQFGAHGALSSSASGLLVALLWLVARRARRSSVAN